MLSQGVACAEVAQGLSVGAVGHHWPWGVASAPSVAEGSSAVAGTVRFPRSVQLPKEILQHFRQIGPNRSAAAVALSRP